MRDKSIVICIGLALVLMSLSVASAEEGEVEVEMEVMPDMFVLSANSPWLELDVYDPGLENYPSFEYLNDTDWADELGLNETEFYAEITNSTGGIIFSGKTEFDRFEIKRSETTGDFVLAIMVARYNVTLDSNSPTDDLDSPLKIEVTGIITYPETEGNQSGDVKFKATDSVVDVKLQGEMPEKAGGGDKGKHAATSETNDVPTSEVVIINANEPACELVTEPVVVSALVSPLTIMLESKCPMFGMEVKNNANGTDADTLEVDYARYDVQDMNDKFLVNIELGVILTEDDGIYNETGQHKVGAIKIENAIDLKNEHDEYEISPETGNLVLQYVRSDVFSSQLGYDVHGEPVTFGAFLESSCSGDDMTGSVPLYIRGVFEEGVYPAGTEFYGESNAIVMGNSQSKKKGGKNK
ncbi:hypothetical protein J7W08_03350 [Methanococcoides orientis]|uniref:hypothetical protein n=1 Tax=Methanococcoides orientis TaxID=2822137 RepID=UPI001E2A06B8|nr:hypothetical protein [Methanococcoides orientis]UGV41345.1 hypothetical protein J7W08_03350 [Methanococcoides orientis]